MRKAPESGPLQSVWWKITSLFGCLTVFRDERCVDDGAPRLSTQTASRITILQITRHHELTSVLRAYLEHGHYFVFRSKLTVSGQSGFTSCNSWSQDLNVSSESNTMSSLSESKSSEL